MPPSETMSRALISKEPRTSAGLASRRSVRGALVSGGAREPSSASAPSARHGAPIRHAATGRHAQARSGASTMAASPTDSRRDAVGAGHRVCAPLSAKLASVRSTHRALPGPGPTRAPPARSFHPPLKHKKKKYMKTDNEAVLFARALSAGTRDAGRKGGSQPKCRPKCEDDSVGELSCQDLEARHAERMPLEITLGKYCGSY